MLRSETCANGKCFHGCLFLYEKIVIILTIFCPFKICNSGSVLFDKTSEKNQKFIFFFWGGGGVW